MSNLPGCKTQLYKRHVLADSGINLIHQRTIAVERFAVLDFYPALPNARLQSGGLDIVHLRCTCDRNWASTLGMMLRWGVIVTANPFLIQASGRRLKLDTCKQ